MLVNFMLVPSHLRLPFVAVVSFAWTVIISAWRGAVDVAAAPLLEETRKIAAHAGPSA